MGRKIFIVSPGYPEMYESLKRALVGDDEVEVVYDRRSSSRPRPARRKSMWSGGPLGELSDRRSPSHVDEDLRLRGWAVVRID